MTYPYNLSPTTRGKEALFSGESHMLIIMSTMKNENKEILLYFKTLSLRERLSSWPSG